MDKASAVGREAAVAMETHHGDNRKELQWQDSTCLELQSETIELA